MTATVLPMHRYLWCPNCGGPLDWGVNLTPQGRAYWGWWCSACEGWYYEEIVPEDERE